jgi:hypothetical protein
MSIFISMSNNIIDFIKKQGNIFNAAKYFGGFDKLRELTKGNGELKSFIRKNSKGWLNFKASGNDYEFDFYILDYDMEDVDNDAVHITLFVDLIVDYPNLSDEELLTIGKWASEYCEDGSLHTVSTGKYIVDKETIAYYMVQVDQINGKDVPWVPSKLLDDQDLIVPDETVKDLIKKSSETKETVTESLIRLQNLFK